MICLCRSGVLHTDEEQDNSCSDTYVNTLKQEITVRCYERTENLQKYICYYNYNQLKMETGKNEGKGRKEILREVTE